MKFLLSILLLHSLAFADPHDVIYGEDNRLDVFESPRQDFQTLARSTSAMIPSIRLQKQNDSFLLRGQTLEERGICPSERFSQQVTASRCSGFLVGDKKVVTAGHCIRNEADCKINRWVFGFQLTEKDQTSVSIKKDDVYKCQKIIAREFSGEQDYAVIELDRSVRDRAPLGVRKSGSPSIGDPLVIIGYPSGLPAKISDGGVVRSLTDLFFVANLDSFGGNSGSAVFNAETLQVEGILVRGELDYIDDESRGCKIAKTCAHGECRGEDVILMKNVKGLDD
jgi:hypothetical protein